MNIEARTKSNRGKSDVKHGQGSGMMPESSDDPAHTAQIKRQISKKIFKHS